MSKDMFNNDKTDSFGTPRGAVATEPTRPIQRWNCPDCFEPVLWQSPMTKADRIYHHYRVAHNEGGNLSVMQPTTATADTSHCAYHDKANCYECGWCPERATQPTPTTGGEWAYKYQPDLSRSGQYLLYDDREWPLAEVYDEVIAVRIVSAHNSIPQLVAALRTTLTHLRLPSELDQAIERPRVVREIEAVLGVVNK